MKTDKAENEIKMGGDQSTWFSVNRYEVIEEAKQRGDLRAFSVYARQMMNEYFPQVIRKFNPDVKIYSLPAYKKVIDWMCNNNRKGLLLMGACGTGKSAIMDTLYTIFASGHAMWYNNASQTFQVEAKFFKKYHANDLQDSEILDEALCYRFVMVDDIGAEPETSIRYGQRRNPLAELVDNAERKNCLLILTSNLTEKELSEKYGERTMDRIHKLCSAILFEGKSFR